jgi:hypothetical protein
LQPTGGTTASLRARFSDVFLSFGGFPFPSLSLTSRR